MRIVFCSAPMVEAKGLARAVIEKRLAACVQVIPRIESVYHWKGEVCEEEEALLLIKTTAEMVGALTQELKGLHSYSVPEIVSVAIEASEGNPDYLKWLQEEVAK